MRILNFGSLNLDFVYEVDHFVRPGETLGALSWSRFCGGKGLNQSIALAKAGAKVLHAGRVGKDGLVLKEKLEEFGADSSLVEIDDGPSGHAIIQVSREGENCIILFGGANMKIGKAQVSSALSKLSKGDFILLQNEISSMPEIMRLASAAGLKIFFNPAPMGPEVKGYPLELVGCFVVNEIEGAELSGLAESSSPEQVLASLKAKFPSADILLTLGSKGALFSAAGSKDDVMVAAEKVKAVDTTAAGDTFIGYFMACLAEGAAPEAAMRVASKAAAITVTRKGAADSIPFRKELGA